MSAFTQAMRRVLPILLGGLMLMSGLAHAGTVTYVYTDPQGTPLAEADASGNITATFDYAPYGSQALGTPPDGPGYTGHVNDPESGLVYMQARYYDPAVGRFLSEDPVGPAAGNLFNVNRYDYANNNPIVNMDPDGRLTGSLLNTEEEGVAGPGYTTIVNPQNTGPKKQVSSPSLTKKIDKGEIVDYIDKHAGNRSQGKCAAYCRRAFEAGGVNTKGHPLDAKDYGPLLLRNRATVVPQNGYKPEKGDVVVFNGSAAHPYGHIAVYDGKQWVSDFKQHHMSPYRSGTPTATVYRFPGN